MASQAYDLLIKIEASTEALRRELGTGAAAVNGFRQNVERNLSGIDRTVGGITRGFSSLRTVLGAVGIAFSVNAFKNMTLDAIKATGDLGDLATQLGVTADTFQTLVFAGSQFGVSSDEISNGVSRLSKTIGEAAEGSKTAIDSFDRLGVKILDAGGKVRSTDAIFREVIQAISEIEDPARRAATGADVFGKGFQKLLPIVNEGAAGFDEIRRQAIELGLILSDDVIASADKASDKLAELSLVLDTQLKTVLVALAPLLISVATGIGDLVKSFNQMVIKDDGVSQLRIYNQELRGFQEELQSIQGGSITGKVGEFFGRDAVFIQEQINRKLKERSDLVQKIFTDASRGAGVIATVDDEGGVNNPLPKPTTGGKSAAEKAAEKIENAIESVRLKLTQLNADVAGDTAGKLLATAFHDAGLSIEDTSAKAEELRVVVELLADATDRAAIGTEGLAAVQQADTAAVQEYEKKITDAATAVDGARTALEIYNDTLAEYNVMLGEGFINGEQFTRLVEKAGEEFVAADEHSQRLIQSAGQLGEGFVSVFGRIGTSINSTNELLEGLLGVLADVLAQLAGGGIEQLIGGVIRGGLATTMAPGGGGLMTDINGPLPGRAAGGRVRGGAAYMVGERGPEPFIPDVPGTVIPTGIAAMGSSTVVNVAVNNVINTNGGGTPAQNRDLSEKVAAATQRMIRQEIDAGIATNLRDRGMFRPNIVG